jgi:predicted unusual protein kinase regulating ubiquinone biosynthesis (AarF/ABC1/UbiB family)
MSRSRAGSAVRQSRLGRGGMLARLALRVGGRYAARSPRLIFASVERRKELRHDLALQTAEDVAEELGSMKGALMKLGQMASYIDEDMPETFRTAMARLQHTAPPMSAALASAVIVEELGDAPEKVFARWDPIPFAAASIGQVHRAITRDGRAVAVKVQYPGIARSITSDLRNVGLLRKIAAAAFPGLDSQSLIEELGERLKEELDYKLEAENQDLFARYYEGHPFVHIPEVVRELSTERVLTSELLVGKRFEELQGWDQHERDLAAETIYRFVFRSLYRLLAFNGDPHPGNYLFEGGGRVSFLDFGLTKHFVASDLAPLVDGARFMVVEPDADRFRAAMERAGFLRAGAPVSTQAVVDRFRHFYGTVSRDAVVTITPADASAIVKRFFDARSPLAPYSDVPRTYAILQRINLGLYAVLGSLNATANWRRITEEIWPFVNAPPSTPMGVEEARWEAQRRQKEPVSA